MRRGIFATRTQKTWVPCLPLLLAWKRTHYRSSARGRSRSRGGETGPGVARQERLLCVVNNDLRRFVSWVMTSSQPPFMSSSISLILCQTCKLHGAFRTRDLFSHANFPRKMETRRGVQTQRHHHHYSKSRQIPKGSRFHVCPCIVRTVGSTERIKYICIYTKIIQKLFKVNP